MKKHIKLVVALAVVGAFLAGGSTAFAAMTWQGKSSLDGVQQDINALVQKVQSGNQSDDQMISNLQSQVNDLTTKNTGLQSQLAQAQSDEQTAQQQVSNLTSQLSTAQADESNLQAQLDQANNDAASLKSYADSALASVSN